MKINIVAILVLFVAAGLTASEPRTMPVIAVSSLCGRGGSSEYIQDVLGVDQSNIIRAKAPLIRRDLGQEKCMQLMGDAVNGITGDKCLIFASSQGAATALNYLAMHYKGTKIKGLVLEGPLMSGNSTIHHTMNSKLAGKFSKIGKFPLSRYWLPYAAKIAFPWYAPSGTQAIKNLKNIPKDIPIVIIHSNNDHQVPFDDACALYYGLRKNGNNNVYFLRFNADAHLNTLYLNKAVVGQLRLILKNHDLIDQDGEKMDLEVQPDALQYQSQYRALMDHERKHWLIGRYVKLSGYVGLLGFACWGIGKEMSNLSKGWKQYELDDSHE